MTIPYSTRACLTSCLIWLVTFTLIACGEDEENPENTSSGMDAIDGGGTGGGTMGGAMGGTVSDMTSSGGHRGRHVVRRHPGGHDHGHDAARTVW